MFEKGLLRDLSRDQSSINSSHEASSVSTRSSVSEQNRESSKSLPKTREELQELVSIELRLKALIDYCCGSGTSVQPGGDNHSRGNSFSQQLVTVTETAASTATGGVPPASNGISSVNNSVTRINTTFSDNSVTRINTTFSDNCRGNSHPNEGGVISGIKSVSFRLSNHQDGGVGGGVGGGGGRDPDSSSLNLSLDKVSVLIRERRSYLEKRLELESLHSKAVRELIRDPSTPSLTMASLQNWNPIGHVMNPAIPSHPMTPSGHGHSVLNGSAPKLRKPRALSLVESADGNFGFDSSSYCNLMQDVKDVKTLLFRLQGLLQLVG